MNTLQIICRVAGVAYVITNGVALATILIRDKTVEELRRELVRALKSEAKSFSARVKDAHEYIKMEKQYQETIRIYESEIRRKDKKIENLKHANKQLAKGEKSYDKENQ